jgi:hypothetical protein
MQHDYRATWHSNFKRCDWPLPGDPRFDERIEIAWDDMRMLMLEYIYLCMADARAFAIDLETILAARVGEEWWREEKISAVGEFLDSM